MSQRSNPAPAASGPDPRRWQALFALALVQFMIVIDNTVVNVALPSIQRGLHFTPSSLAWVVNGYIVAAGGLLMLGGRAADLFGRRRLFLAGTVVFAIASLTSGLAQNPAMLIVSRFGQGVGEAMASPAALSIIALLFLNPKERLRAFGIWGGLAGMGAAVGVIMSGVITDVANWRWVFFINVPVAAAAVLLVPRLIKESRSSAAKRIDVPGAVLLTGGLIAIVDGLLAAVGHSWEEARVVWPLAGGAMALAAFVLVEARSRNPLIPLAFFANRTRLTANVATVFMVSGLMGMFFLLTLYMQNVLGYSPLKGGLAYVPFTVGIVAGVGATTRLVSRLGPRFILTVAFLIMTGGMLLMSRVPVDGSYLQDLLPPMLVLAFGMGMGFTALQSAALHQVSEQDAGLGSGVQTTVSQIGGALGLAVLVTVALRHADGAVSTGTSAAAASTDGYTLGFRVAAAALAAGALLCFALVQRTRPEGEPAKAAVATE